jgi:hypothetical protein
VPTYLFSAPTDRVPARTLHGQPDSAASRLARRTAPPPKGRNVFIVNGVATSAQPFLPLTASRTFFGGHVPEEVTEAEKTILEAAGYTVTEVP